MYIMYLINNILIMYVIKNISIMYIIQNNSIMYIINNISITYILVTKGYHNLLAIQQTSDETLAFTKGSARSS